MTKSTVENNAPKIRDPLLDCLEFFCKETSQQFSPNAIVAGLPLVNNKLTPEIFSKAAKRIGFNAKIKKIKLHKITIRHLPCILFLEDSIPYVATEIVGGDKFKVIDPSGPPGNKRFLDFSDIEDSYKDYIITVEQICKFDDRSTQFQALDKTSWFWDVLVQYKYIYARAVVGSILINCFALASPLFVMNVYDRVVPNNAVETLWALAFGVAFIYIFDVLMRTLRVVLIDTAGKKADIVLSSQIFQRVLGMELQHKPMSAGAFSNRLHEFDSLADFFTSAILVGLIDLPFVVVFLLTIYMLAGPLVLIGIIAIPLVILSSIIFEIPMHDAVEKAMRSKTQKHAIVVEAINNIETIKHVAAEGLLQRRWEAYVSLAAGYGLISRVFSGLASHCTIFVQNISYAIIIVWGVYLISEQKLTMGGLIACSILNSRALAPLAQVTNLLTRLTQTRTALKSVNEIMKLDQERGDDRKFMHRTDFNGDIKFRDVSFTYPNQKKISLDNVSFHIKPKEKVGILGKMGSGKTTILKLILNFYKPQAGSVKLDDTDVQQIDPADLRLAIGLVEQNISLFYGTVRNNIAIAKPTATDEEILKAAKIAGADTFIDYHPSGYDMMIGENGAGLSGGQQQTLVIARTLINNPPIILLDEPTALMDKVSEIELMRRMEQIFKDKTVVMVTHSAPLLTLLDRLIVLDQGRIIADGPKDEVIASLKSAGREKQEKQEKHGRSK